MPHSADTRPISSVIDGRPAPGPAAGRFLSTNPARLDDVVAEVALADAPTLVTAARAARAAQRAWADVPAPVRGRAIANIGRLIEANKEALAGLVAREIGKPYPEALGEVQEIIDTCDFFLGEGRRLYGETVPSEMHGQAAVHVPQPGRRGRGDHRGELPGRGPVLVHRARAAVRQRRGVEAGRVLGGRGGRLPRAVLPRRRAAARGVQRGATPTALRPSPAWSRRWTRAWSTRSGSPARREVGARIGELAGRHLQSACLELGGKNPMVVTRDADLDLAVEGALFSGLRHRRASGAPRSAP